MLAALNREADAQPDRVLLNITEDIDRFVDGAEQFDDMTMLCFRYQGPSVGEKPILQTQETEQ